MSFQGSNRFELIRKLGEGGMGLVYEAWDRQRAMRVALKTLRRLDAGSLYRFKREFRALNDLSHPNIVGLYELVSDGDDWFFTMELVEGVDFISHVRPTGWHDVDPALGHLAAGTGLAATDETLPLTVPEHLPAGVPGPLAVEDAPTERRDFPTLIDEARLRAALAGLAQALCALHRLGMVHRDLKPSNVRVTAAGRVVLMDFGIVADSTTGLDDDLAALGTPAYMAPEQAAGEPPTPAADWYSFGVLLYCALTERLPFVGARQQILIAKQDRKPLPPGHFTRGIPDDLDRLCKALLARQPSRRPAGGAVLAELGCAAADAELTAAEQVPFVGRARELADLHDAFARMRAGAVGSVFVQGPSGMGKSTLVRRFLHELDAAAVPEPRRARPGSEPGATPTAITLRGRCHERESLPFKAFDGVIDSLSHLLLGLAPARAAALLPEGVELLTRLFPVLRRVPDLRGAAHGLPLDPVDLRARAVRALRGLLRNLARWRPLILYIDDLQWADRDSLDLLIELVREPGAPPLLLVAALRAENLAADRGLADALATLAAGHDSRTIAVGPLSTAEQRLLVARLLGVQAAPHRVAHVLEAEAEGNPLFLAELVRFAREEPEARGGAAAAPIRITLEEVLHRRIARLPDGAQALLAVVAAAGEPVPAWLLGDAADLDSDERERAAAVLRVGNLVRVARHGEQPWLTAYHDRVRETLMARLPAPRRCELHRRLAEALERWDEATPDALARHWLAAGDGARATTYLAAAARAASEQLAFDRAAELYQDALAAGGARGLLERPLGDALALAGRSFEAAEVYRRAAADAAPDAGLELSRLAAEHLIRSGHIVHGLAALREVMGRLGVRVPETRRRALLSLVLQRARIAVRGLGYKVRPAAAIAPQDLGRLDTLYAASTSLGVIDHIRGADLQTRHVLAALRLGEERRVCRALAIEAVFRAAAGGRGLVRADTLSRAVEQQARRLGEPYLIGVALLGIGAANFFGGRAAGAATAFTEAERLFANECTGAEWERVTAGYFLCQSHVTAGALALAAAEAERFSTEAARRHDVYATNLFATQPTAWRLLLADRSAEAGAALAGALDGWPRDTFYTAHYFAMITGAIIGLYEGRADEVRRTLLAARPALATSMLDRIPWLMTEYNMYLGRAALRSDDLPTAARAADGLDRVRLPYGDALAVGLRAAVAGRRGDRAGGQRLLEEAGRRFDGIGAGHLAAAHRYRLGGVLGGASGAALVDGAEAWFSGQGAANLTRWLDLLAPMF